MGYLDTALEIWGDCRGPKEATVGDHEEEGELCVTNPLPPASSTEPPAPKWPPRDRRLGLWPADWRERWGRRANDLEDEGLTWREAEVQAFGEVLAARLAEGLPDHGTVDEREAVEADVVLTDEPVLIPIGSRPTRTSAQRRPTPLFTPEAMTYACPPIIRPGESKCG